MTNHVTAGSALDRETALALMAGGWVQSFKYFDAREAGVRPEADGRISLMLLPLPEECGENSAAAISAGLDARDWLVQTPDGEVKGSETPNSEAEVLELRGLIEGASRDHIEVEYRDGEDPFFHVTIRGGSGLGYGAIYMVRDFTIVPAMDWANFMRLSEPPSRAVH